MAEGPCEILTWDSEFFGRRIARLRDDRLDSGTVAGILAWCRDNAVDCLYFLASCHDRPTVRLAQHHGFDLVDVRLTFERPLSDRPVSRASERLIRPGRREDLSALRSMARVNHRDSRFYFDGRFPEERCHSLYEEWLERSFDGWAEALWVVDHEEAVAGYLSAHLRGEGVGQIGLVGVSPRARGRKLGSRLLSESLDWFAESGAGKVEVVTQGRNVAAQRLYQKHGFVTRSLELWFHRWWNGAQEGDPR